MPAEAISDSFDQRRAVAFTGTSGGFGDRAVNIEYVHAIDSHAWHFVGLGETVQLFLANRVLYECAHAIKVILADEHDRQLPQRSEIQAFMKGALRQRAIAKKTADHFGLFLIHDGQPQASREGQSATDDGVSAHEAQVSVEQMH